MTAHGNTTTISVSGSLPESLGAARRSGARRSIRSKLAAVVLVGTVTVAMAIGTLMWRTAVTLFLKQAQSEIDKKNQSIAGALDSLAEKAADAALLLHEDSAFARYFASRSPGAREDLTALSEVNKKLKILHAMFAIDEACLIDISGVELARVTDGKLATATDLSPDESKQAFFAPTVRLHEGQVYRSPVPYLSEDTGKWALAHATPIVGRDGHTLGVLHFEIPLKWFTDKIRALSGDGSYSFLLSRNDLLLMAPTGPESSASARSIEPAGEAASFVSATDYGNDSFRRLTARMLAEQSGSGTFFDNHGEPQEVVYRPIYGGMWVVASAIPHSVFATQTAQLLRSTILTAIPILALALSLILWVSGRMTGPLRAMTASLRAVARGQHGALVPQRSNDELGEMSNALGEMIDYHGEMTRVAEAIARGDLSGSVVPRSEHDGLGHSFVRMSASLREMLSTIRAAEARFRSLVQNANDTILLVDPAGRISFASPAVTRFIGYTPEEVTDRRLASIANAEDEALLTSILIKAAATTATDTRVELRFQHRDGSTRHGELVLSNCLHDDTIRAIVGTCHDITERKVFEEELTRMAFHDALTGLPNRALLRDRLQNALSRALRDEHDIAILFIDLDNFKLVNDSLGHDAGDILLKEVAQRLVNCVRTSDTVARLGGDEFVVMLDPCDSCQAVEEVAERIIAALKEHTTIGAHSLVMLASLGIALNNERDMQANTLLSNADTAMYNAKATGKGRYVVFEQAMNDSVVERVRLEADLRVAIERGELIIHYQPIVDLESGRLGEVEALLRWQHPELGLIPPTKFIPIAEESGLIIEIGNWVLREGCRQLQSWQRESELGADLCLSVNLSTRQFQNPNLLEDIKAVIHEFSIEPRHLKLEITESVMMQDTDDAVAILQRLKSVGIMLAIDDFGTGYSSLSYLRTLPVDVLKIDRAFVSGLGRSGPDGAIVRSIIELAKSLNLSVTAEGIETETQASELGTMLCNNGQGYLFSKPVPKEAISGLLTRAGTLYRAPKALVQAA